MVVNEYVYAKLKKTYLGLAIGVTNGLCMMLLAWGAWQWDYGTAMVEQLASMYYAYGPSFVGGLVGFGWGFLDGFILGFLIAFFYNLCFSCCRKRF